MRVALLSTIEPSADDPATPRGFVRVAGRSIVQHQLGAVLAIGAERVICIAEGLPGELIALQHAAERAGLNFQIAANARGLARLVGPDDELFVLLDGLLAMPEEVKALSGSLAGPGSVVLVQLVEQGVASGYERIDLNHAAAGLLRMPGRLVARLAELPAEWNPQSALLRIAVQAGLPQRVLPGELADSARWNLVRGEDDAHRIEPPWLRLHTVGEAPGSDLTHQGPGAATAGWLVRRLGPGLLHAGTKPSLVAAGAGMIGLFALGAAWFSWSTLAFVLLAAAGVVRRMAALLERIERDSFRTDRARFGDILSWLIDALFVVATTWRALGTPALGVSIYAAGFAALVLFGMLRLLSRSAAPARLRGWFSDRLLAGLGLAAASLTNVFGLALMGACLILLLIALLADGTAADAAENRAPSG
ncbi:hypothetical protein ACFO0A_10585 [Novosphingobium tardum]|uniref:CDP-alcohol phosphatidyltransferase n=1 Tax=Novosphingobium tardum TaxID=1538021 RepID=A0ABV8RRW5_9SPHN